MQITVPVNALIVARRRYGSTSSHSDTCTPSHRRYTGFINARHRWTGHLWQGRFGAVAMDESHLANAMRYVSLNPMRARLVKQAADWRWSSVAAHLAGEDDMLVKVAPALERYGSFADFLGKEQDDEAAWRQLRMSETSGRPIGDDDWMSKLEEQTGRTLKPQKRGPKKLSEFSKLAP